MKICPVCQTNAVDGAVYCHMCGTLLKDAQAKAEELMRSGQKPLCRHTFQALSQEKSIEVWCHDITTFPQHFDLLTVSAFTGNYNINTRTVIGALWRNLHIDTESLIKDAFIDLRPVTGCWLSRELPAKSTENRIGRIGCLTLDGRKTSQSTILKKLKAYFHMLDLAADAGIAMDTLALPIVGTGNQNIKIDQMLIPLINEILSMMYRNDSVKKVLLIERTFDKAKIASEALQKSYHLSYSSARTDVARQQSEPYVFISYSTHGDTQAADLMRDALRARGVNYWYAPENIITGDYSSQIVEAIRKTTHFICIISRNTSTSLHVLNELDLAFNRLNEGLSILPFLLDDAALGDSYSYYLSRIQWNYGYPAPLEQRIDEFLDRVLLPQS